MGTQGRESDHVLLMHAQEGLESLGAQECHMGKGAEGARSHQHVPRTQRRRQRSALGHVVGVPGGREHLPQEAPPGMQQGEQVGHREPTPRALPTGVTNVLLSCRRIWHGNTGPVHQERAVASPPPLVVGRLVADRCRPTQSLLPDDERSPGTGGSDCTLARGPPRPLCWVFGSAQSAARGNHSDAAPAGCGWG